MFWWSSSEYPTKALYMEPSSNTGWPMQRVSISISKGSPFCTMILLVFVVILTSWLTVFVSPAASTIIFAEKSFKITYTPASTSGEGTSATTTLTPIAYSKAVSEGFTLPAVAPQRAGYTFAGWYTNASFTGTAYTAGQILRNEPNNENNITLYAKWTENATVPSTNNNNSTTITDPEVPGSSSNNSNVVVVLNYNSKKITTAPYIRR